MINIVQVYLSPGTFKRVRFEAAWRQDPSLSETIESLILEGLRAREEREAQTVRPN